MQMEEGSHNRTHLYIKASCAACCLLLALSNLIATCRTATSDSAVDDGPSLQVYTFHAILLHTLSGLPSVRQYAVLVPR